MAYNFEDMRFRSYSNSSEAENLVGNFDVGLILPPTPPEDKQENSRIAPAVLHLPLNSLNVNQAPVENYSKCRAEYEAMISKKSKARPIRQRRQRTAFTSNQLIELERIFLNSHYINRPGRIVLAAKLKLCESQIKIWFQNRRMKLKKENKSAVNPANRKCLLSVENLNPAPNVQVSEHEFENFNIYNNYHQQLQQQQQQQQMFGYSCNYQSPRYDCQYQQYQVNHANHHSYPTLQYDYEQHSYPLHYNMEKLINCENDNSIFGWL